MRLPVGLVLVPVLLAHLHILPGRVAPVVELILVKPIVGLPLLQLGAHGVDDDPCSHLELDVCDVGGFVQLFVRLLSRQLLHQSHARHPVVLLGEVVQVLVRDSVAIAPDASGEGGEVGRVHARGVYEHDAAPVARAPVAYDLLHLVQAVELKVAEQPQGLDDARDVLELPTVDQVERETRHPLDGALDVLQHPVDHGKEGDVANPKPAVLDDGRAAAVLRCMDRPVLPGVAHASEVIHGLEHVEHLLPGRGYGALVHEPAWHARAGEVLPPRAEVDLPGLELAAGPHVLDGEGAVAEDSHAAAGNVVIWHVVVHAIAKVTIE
mmetsp:Transcript_64145/g.144787  ORF Transcript_64145/g.144787 Transcript_64145/m.144787 type:complete len:323 (-) Transcript_64145:1001-1969(-)